MENNEDYMSIDYVVNEIIPSLTGVLLDQGEISSPSGEQCRIIAEAVDAISWLIACRQKYMEATCGLLKKSLHLATQIEELKGNHENPAIAAYDELESNLGSIVNFLVNW